MPQSERARELLRELHHLLEDIVPDAAAHPERPARSTGRLDAVLASARATEDQLRGLLAYLPLGPAERMEADRLLLVYRVNARALADWGSAPTDGGGSRHSADRRLTESAARHAGAVGALGALAVLLGNGGEGRGLRVEG